MEEMRNAYRIFVRKREEKSASKDAGIDGMIILKWMFGKFG
jgi:hypothetical protein